MNPNDTQPKEPTPEENAELQTIENDTPNPEEVMEVTWLDQIELATKVKTNPDEFTPWLRIYMLKHFEQISGTITAQLIGKMNYSVILFCIM